MSRQSELGRYLRAVPHRPALPARLEEFVAFLWQIAPIWPVSPTSPAYKPFAVNKTSVARHLHTVEVAGSNPAAPTMESTTYRQIPWCIGSIWQQMHDSLRGVSSCSEASRPPNSPFAEHRRKAPACTGRRSCRAGAAACPNIFHRTLLCAWVAMSGPNCGMWTELFPHRRGALWSFDGALGNPGCELTCVFRCYIVLTRGRREALRQRLPRRSPVQQSFHVQPQRHRLHVELRHSE